MKPNIEEILQHLNSIANNIKNETSFESLPEFNCPITAFYNFDSLEFMTFISAIEKEFNFQFPEDITFEQLNDFNNIVGFI